MTPRALSMSATRQLATSAARQDRNRVKKAHDFVGAEHDRQLVRFARVGDELGDVGSPERHAVKEPQGAHDLVEPGHEMPLPARCT